MSGFTLTILSNLTFITAAFPQLLLCNSSGDGIGRNHVQARLRQGIIEFQTLTALQLTYFLSVEINLHRKLRYHVSESDEHRQATSVRARACVFVVSTYQSTKACTLSSMYHNETVVPRKKRSFKSKFVKLDKFKPKLV